jgi:hypothetical protein
MRGLISLSEIECKIAVAAYDKVIVNSTEKNKRKADRKSGGIAVIDIKACGLARYTGVTACQ